MAQRGPADAFLFVRGRDISGETFQLEVKLEDVKEQSNGLGDSMEEHLPVGLARASISASGGFYDSDTAKLVEALISQGQTNCLVDWGASGRTIGSPVGMMEGTFPGVFNRVADRGALTKANGEYRPTGQHAEGRIVNAAAFTADPFNTRTTPVDQNDNGMVPLQAITSNSLANPSVVTTPAAHGLITGDVVMIAGVITSNPTINGERTVTVISPTTFSVPVNVTTAGTGGTFKKLTSASVVLDLQVLDLVLGGFTNVVITPVHSVDNSTYVTLGSAFANITAKHQTERKTVTAVVRRYVALDGDWTGAGSANTITPYVAVARA